MMAELAIRPSWNELWENRVARIGCDLLHILQKPHMLNGAMDRNATLLLFVFDLLRAFVVDVEIMDAILAPHISSMQLRELFEAIAVIDAENGEPRP